MKFGQFFLFEQFEGRTDTEIYRDSLEQTQVADELGYDTAWLAEHRFSPYGILPDTMQFGAAVAATTQRIRIGTAVIVLPFHHPINLAEQIAMLDVMSNGRVDLGVGRGYQAQEYRSFNIDMDESRARFEETLEVMKGLWTTDNYSHHGQFFTINDATLKPKPVQKPYPPIHMAVMRTPSSFKYALDNDYSFLLGNPYAHDPGIIEALDTYNRMMAEMGHMDVVNDSWALAKCFTHEDDDEAVRITEASWASYVRNLVEHGTPVRSDGTLSKDYQSHSDFGKALEGVMPMDPRDNPSVIVGNPKRCRERIAEMKASGIPNLILWFNNGGGIPQAEVLKSMELFAKEVMPEFA